MSAAKLHKSAQDRLIFGVCGGLGEYLDVDPVLVRLAFVLLAFAGGAGVAAYIVLALIMPQESAKVAEPMGVIRENLEGLATEATEAGRRLVDAARAGAAPQATGEPEERARLERRRNTFGLFLVVMGAISLAITLGAFWWGGWAKLWPLLLIAIGLLIILGRSRRPG